MSFFQITSKTRQRIPKYLSNSFKNKTKSSLENQNYFKNQKQGNPEILSDYFIKKIQGVCKILSNYFKNKTSDSRDSFNLPQKLSTKSFRTCFKENKFPRFFQTTSETKQKGPSRIFQTTSKTRHRWSPRFFQTTSKTKHKLLSSCV